MGTMVSRAEVEVSAGAGGFLCWGVGLWLVVAVPVLKWKFFKLPFGCWDCQRLPGTAKPVRGLLASCRVFHLGAGAGSLRWGLPFQSGTVVRAKVDFRL